MCCDPKYIFDVISEIIVNIYDGRTRRSGHVIVRACVYPGPSRGIADPGAKVCLGPL